VQRGAALYALEGDFGFSAPNATDPAPEVGHEIKLINFSKQNGPLQLKIMGFARNSSGDQAFIVPGFNGFNRPTNIKFGPDGWAWVVHAGAGRALGPGTLFVGPPQSGPRVQIPGTGVIWRICNTAAADDDSQDDDSQD